MELFKKSLLALILFLGITIGANAQSGWSTSQWYQYRGQSWTEWRVVTVGYDYNGYPINQRQCRQTVWYSEQRQGYVYVWGPNGWYTQWYTGTAWRCYWGAWYPC